MTGVQGKQRTTERGGDEEQLSAQTAEQGSGGENAFGRGEDTHWLAMTLATACGLSTAARDRTARSLSHRCAGFVP